jgi:hypothetical protein
MIIELHVMEEMKRAAAKNTCDHPQIEDGAGLVANWNLELAVQGRSPEIDIHNSVSCLETTVKFPIRMLSMGRLFAYE